MLTILSPSKSVTSAKAPLSLPLTTPQLLDCTGQLLHDLQNFSAKDLEKTLGVSEKLAEVNYGRFQNWQKPIVHRQAIYVFAGDVYNGLDAFSLSKDTALYTQGHLGIISGLYGYIRPFDKIQPYRLEMKVKLKGPWGDNLYDFWENKIASIIEATGEKLILNLASLEYSKVFLDHLSEDIDVISPRFLQRSTSGLKEKALFAKYARGAMARWVMETQVDSARELEGYCLDGFTYSPELSKPGAPVFIVPADFSLLGRFKKLA